MSIKQIAAEYFHTASHLKERVDELRRLQKTKNFEEQKKIEDRIVLLNAECCHLVHIAAYLDQYYSKLSTVSPLEVS